jgi:hypothetical protein
MRLCQQRSADCIATVVLVHRYVFYVCLFSFFLSFFLSFNLHTKNKTKEKSVRTHREMKQSNVFVLIQFLTWIVSITHPLPILFALTNKKANYKETTDIPMYM